MLADTKHTLSAKEVGPTSSADASSSNALLQASSEASSVQITIGDSGSADTKEPPRSSASNRPVTFQFPFPFGSFISYVIFCYWSAAPAPEWRQPAAPYQFKVRRLPSGGVSSLEYRTGAGKGFDFWRCGSCSWVNGLDQSMCGECLAPQQKAIVIVSSKPTSSASGGGDLKSAPNQSITTTDPSQQHNAMTLLTTPTSAAPATKPHHHGHSQSRYHAPAAAVAEFQAGLAGSVAADSSVSAAPNSAPTAVVGWLCDCGIVNPSGVTQCSACRATRHNTQ